MLTEAKTIDHSKLLSRKAGLRVVAIWFLQRNDLTQYSLAEVVYDATPRRKVSQRMSNRGNAARCMVF